MKKSLEPSRFYNKQYNIDHGASYFLLAKMSDESDYDLSSVMDEGNIGPDPSKEYMQSLDMLDNVARECIFVSRGYSDIASPTARHFYASVLFTSLITRGVSLLNLAPLTPWAEKKIEHSDYASLAGIARTMIELRVAFYYLCGEPCSEDEWACRWHLFNLHDCVTRMRMFDALGDSGQVEAFMLQADDLRNRLRSNVFFQELDSKRHKELLHGQKAYLFPLEDIAKNAGIAVGKFRWLHILFSSHVHGLPMSFYRMGGDHKERGRGLPSPSEESYSSLCLSLAASLLVATRDEVHHLFEGLDRVSEETIPHEVDEEAIQARLAVDECNSLDVTANIRLVFTRTAPDTVEVAYFCRQREELVLERSDSANGGAMLKWFDSVFWSVSVNGEPATEQKLLKFVESPHFFRVDHTKSKIIFKHRVER